MRVPEATSVHECAPDDNESNEDEGAKCHTFSQPIEGSAGKDRSTPGGSFFWCQKKYLTTCRVEHFVR
jgi:hypothetical protein